MRVSMTRLKNERRGGVSKQRKVDEVREQQSLAGTMRISSLIFIASSMPFVADGFMNMCVSGLLQVMHN